MFERFSKSARTSLVDAQDEARRLHHPGLGPEHLLYGLLVQTDSIAAQALRAHGLDAADVHRGLAGRTESDPLDEDALATLGIDLDAVRRVVEASFGPGALESRKPPTAGHLPVTKDLKKVLGLSLREAQRLGHDHIGSGHVLLGLLRAGGGVAGQILADAHVDLAALRDDLTRRMPGQAA
jgi:ATP-dependent Clp protease ATP-binding subunit ClpA